MREGPGMDSSRALCQARARCRSRRAYDRAEQPTLTNHDDDCHGNHGKHIKVPLSLALLLLLSWRIFRWPHRHLRAYT